MLRMPNPRPACWPGPRSPFRWIATQTWCNAKVGTWGTSALGFIQYQTAQHNPPHLVCCTIQAKDFLNSYEQSYYGGVYRKEHVENVARLGLASTNLVLSHPMEDTYWRLAETQSDVATNMRVPILVVTGPASFGMPAPSG
jgi:predicted acyl esterase